MNSNVSDLMSGTSVRGVGEQEYKYKSKIPDPFSQIEVQTLVIMPALLYSSDFG